MSSKVKICGVRDEAGVKAAVAAGADYIGFNFVPDSKRRITLKQAKRLINLVSGRIGTVGIFQNQEIEVVNDIVNNLRLDLVQLHGDETMEFVNNIPTKVIKAFRLDRNTNVQAIINRMRSYKTEGFLLDRQVQGSGSMIDLGKAKLIARMFPIYFAGGLNPNNVAEIIQVVQPYGVDVAGGIETAGTQDPIKITEFITNAKGSTL